MFFFNEAIFLYHNKISLLCPPSEEQYGRDDILTDKRRDCSRKTLINDLPFIKLHKGGHPISVLP
jgi:hypothetical protein